MQGTVCRDFSKRTKYRQIAKRSALPFPYGKYGKGIYSKQVNGRIEDQFPAGTYFAFGLRHSISMDQGDIYIFSLSSN
jgi:hypothetical protein